jgi:hypothetical protein
LITTEPERWSIPFWTAPGCFTIRDSRGSPHCGQSC